MRLNALSAEIHKQYGNVFKFAQESGIHYTYLSRLLGGKLDFKKSTVLKIAKDLNIAPCDYAFYFYPESCEVTNHSTGNYEAVV